MGSLHHQGAGGGGGIEQGVSGHGHFQPGQAFVEGKEEAEEVIQGRKEADEVIQGREGHSHGQVGGEQKAGLGSSTYPSTDPSLSPWADRNSLWLLPYAQI